MYKKKFAAHLPLRWAQAPHMEPQILQIPDAANTCPKYSLKKGRPQTLRNLPFPSLLHHEKGVHWGRY